MQKNDYALGGEQSGHIILKKYATTGDGLLTAIMICEEICDSKLSLKELAVPVKLCPQFIKNIRVKDKDAVIKDAKVIKEVEAVEKLMEGKGRALLRPSGTEPVIRVMTETENENLCKEYADRIAAVIIEGGHSID